MRKSNICILWLLLSVIFTTSCFASVSTPLEKNVKEALVEGDWDRAIEVASAWKEQARQEPVPYLVLAYAYYAKGDYRKIAALVNFIDTREKKELLLTWAKEFAQEYPQQPFPYLLKADACVRLKKYFEAVKEFDAAEKFGRDNFLVYIAKGMNYFLRNTYDSAIENFNRAIRLEPRSADAYNNRGITYYCLEDFNAALRDFNQAIEIKPDFSLAYLGRAAVYHYLGKDDLALNDFNKADELQRQGFAMSYKRENDPLTGRIMHDFSVKFGIHPEIKTPAGSFGRRIQGIDSEPEGKIIMVKEGGTDEKAFGSKFIVPAVSFLLYNDQFCFKASRGK